MLQCNISQTDPTHAMSTQIKKQNLDTGVLSLVTPASGCYRPKAVDLVGLFFKFTSIE